MPGWMALPSAGSPSGWPTRCRSAGADHGQCQARDAGQLARLVLDPDFPDLRAAADMDRSRGAGDRAATDGPHVIGVDLEAHADLAFGHAQVAGAAAEGL